MTYRENLGVSVRECAKRLGVSAPSVSRIERGLQQPSPDLSRLIEEATGVPRWQLRPDIWDAPRPRRRA